MRAMLISLLAAVLLAFGVAAVPVMAVTFNQPAQTYTGSVDTLFPNSTGHNVAGLLSGQGISISSTMNLADQQDATLFLTFALEVTSDTNGQTGWFELFGGTWQGGQSRSGTSPPPTMGPFQTSSWSVLNINRIRVRVNPSRTVNNLAWSVAAN